MAALILNWFVYRGGSADRLSKAAEVATKLHGMQVEHAQLLESRYYSFLRRDISLGALKPLAFTILWLSVSVSILTYGRDNGRQIDLFFIGILVGALGLMNLNVVIDRITSPEAEVKQVLAARERNLLRAFLGKKPEEATTPAWVTVTEAAVSEWLARYRQAVLWLLFAIFAVCVASGVWYYFWAL